MTDETLPLSLSLSLSPHREREGEEYVRERVREGEGWQECGANQGGRREEDFEAAVVVVFDAAAPACK